MNKHVRMATVAVSNLNMHESDFLFFFLNTRLFPRRKNALRMQIKSIMILIFDDLVDNKQFAAHGSFNKHRLASLKCKHSIKIYIFRSVICLNFDNNNDNKNKAKIEPCTKQTGIDCINRILLFITSLIEFCKIICINCIMRLYQRNFE